MIKYSSAENEYLVHLLRCALKSEKPSPPPDNLNWKALFDTSKAQQIYSMILPVIDLDSVPKNIAEKLCIYSQNELLRMLAMKNELTLIEKELEKNQIRYMLLKGSVIKNYYPLERMRQMSDYDILYDVKKKAVLFEIMKKNGYNILSCSENSDDFTKKPFYTFEFHRELFYREHEFFCDFSNVWDNAVKAEDSEYRYEMSREDLYLHSIAHMNKHYRYGGFGVRFLADTYLLLKSDWDVLDREYVFSRLKEFKLTEFEEFIRVLSLEIFTDCNFSQEQIDFLNKSLNFGIYGDGSGITVYFDEFKRQNKNATPLNFFLSKFFPSSEYMKKNYRILEKKPYLMPAYYIYRIFYKIKYKGKATIHNYKVLKEYTKKDN